MTAIVTRESLQTMLNNQNRAYVEKVVGRALVALLQFQTASEQNDNSTKEHNNVGFTGADAHSGSLTAKYWMKHSRLEDWMIENWVKSTKSGFSRLTKYHRQLNSVAVGRAK